MCEDKTQRSFGCIEEAGTGPERIAESWQHAADCSLGPTVNAKIGQEVRFIDEAVKKCQLIFLADGKCDTALPMDAKAASTKATDTKKFAALLKTMFSNLQISGALGA